MRRLAHTSEEHYCIDTKSIDHPSTKLGLEEAIPKLVQGLIKLKKLVLGIGNPIMGDEGVGIYVARMVGNKVQSRADLQVKELGASGLKLVEEILGYVEVVIVDSYAAENALRQTRYESSAPKTSKTHCTLHLPMERTSLLRSNYTRTSSPIIYPRVFGSLRLEYAQQILLERL